MLSENTHQLVFLPVGVFPGTAAAGQKIKITIERCEWLEQQSIDEVVSVQDQILSDPNFFVDWKFNAQFELKFLKEMQKKGGNSPGKRTTAKK